MEMLGIARRQTLVGAALALLFGCGVAQAATYTVNTLADSDGGSCGFTCSLRDAINAANSDGVTTGDTITFGVSGTIVLGSTLPAISTALLTIDGAGQSITISGGTTFDNGGAMVVNPGTTLNLIALTFSGNSAGGGADLASGGGVIYNAGTLSVANSAFSGNLAYQNGGGAILNAGSLTVSDSSFSDNSVAQGGGGGAILNNLGAALTVSNSTFSGNTATAGGALYSSGTLIVTSSTFSANTAGNGGGAIASNGTLTVTNSTFSDNSLDVGSHFGGGAIAELDGTAAIGNSTFSGNTGANAGDGGAIALYAGNVTGSLTLFNSILKGAGTGGNCADPSLLGGSIAITDGGGNLGDDSSCFLPTTSSRVVTDLELNLDTTGLKNNGGPTQTIALMSPSAAIGFATANCPATDQRGFPRPSPTLCDAGAFQVSVTGAISAIDTASKTFTAGDSTIHVIENTQYSGCESLLVFGDLKIGDLVTVVVAPQADGSFIALAVNRLCPLTLACPTATAQVAVPYSSALSATGGVPPYTISISSGSLPDGLSLDSATGAITGTPITALSYGFTAQVRATSGFPAGAVATSCTITVYFVEYQISSFSSPVPRSKWKRGQTVPVKFMLTAANGVPISDEEAAGLLSPTCMVKVSATGAEKLAETCVTYDALNHQFQYNWKLSKTGATGDATIKVTVSYAGTMTTTVRSSVIAITAR